MYVWFCLFLLFCSFVFYVCARGCVCFLVFVFVVWELLQQLLYVRVKFETAHCQPVISVTRNKSDKSEFIPEHKLNVKTFGKNCHETSISRIL